MNSEISHRRLGVGHQDPRHSIVDHDWEKGIHIADGSSEIRQETHSLTNCFISKNIEQSID